MQVVAMSNLHVFTIANNNVCGTEIDKLAYKEMIP